MVSNERRNQFIDFLFCDCTRGMVEDMAMAAGYKNPKEFSRPQLERIAYVDYIFGECSNRRFQIIDATTSETLVKNCSRKFMIDFMLRKCILSCFRDVWPATLRGSEAHKVDVVALEENISL